MTQRRTQKLSFITTKKTTVTDRHRQMSRCKSKEPLRLVTSLTQLSRRRHAYVTVSSTAAVESELFLADAEDLNKENGRKSGKGMFYTKQCR